MKKIFIALLSLAASSGFARTYKCDGLDQEKILVNLNSSNEIIGTLNGSKVYGSDSAGMIRLGIVNGNLQTIIEEKVATFLMRKMMVKICIQSLV